MNMPTKEISMNLLERTIFLVMTTLCVAASASSAPAAEPPNSAVPPLLAAPASRPQKSPTDLVARVNGVPITWNDMLRETRFLLLKSGVPQNIPPEEVKKLGEIVLERLIDKELLYQKAAGIRVKGLDKKVADLVAEFRKGAKSPAELEQALKENYLTESELPRFFRKGLVINNFIEQEITGKITVSEAEVKKLYDDNRDKLRKPASYHASHILIAVRPEADTAEKQKARDEAEALRKRILAGEDFSAVAKASSSSGNGAQGGDLGFLEKGEMLPPFENAVNALKPGEVSGVVETQFGFHIIKLIEKKDGAVIPLAEVRGDIANSVKQGKAQKAVADLIAQLKSSAKIEKLDQ